MSEPETKREEAAKPHPSKLSAERALPQSSNETLVKIIKAYAVASNGGENQVNYKDVASAAGLHPTIVSASNRFLAESEILLSPKYGYYVPSEDAIRFAREAAWDEDGAKVHLRRIVSRCWYGEVAIQNLTLRPSLTRRDFRKSLAIKCGAGEGDANALDFLVDFIVYTGLADIDDTGTITRGNFDEIDIKPPSLLTSEVTQVSGSGNLITPSATPPISPLAEKGVSVTIHVHIHDFADLTSEHAAVLRQWISLLKETSDSIDVQIPTELSQTRPAQTEG
jgi:hypothetical protein